MKTIQELYIKSRRFIYYFILGLYLLMWNIYATQKISPQALFVITGILIIAPLLGDIFLKKLIAAHASINSLSMRLLIGILLLNCLLFLLMWLIPLGLILNFCLLSLVVLVAYTRINRIILLNAYSVDNQAEAILILISGFLVTLWCRDVLQPPWMSSAYLETIAWYDVYYHMSQMGVLIRAPILSAESDILMSGVPLRVYHYASYLLPALIAKASGGIALETYASFLVPIGLVLTSLAAYALIASIFGAWPGLFAGLAILLLPDPFQQGFGNLFLGRYFWLLQASPAMGYGIASAALAFTFILLGIRKIKFAYILIGYLFVGITFLYKAQLFVAIAYPALLIPILFYEKKSLWWRSVILLTVSTLFFGVIHFSQLYGSMPTIRLDGSGFNPYTDWIRNIQEPGLIKDILSSPITLSRRFFKIPVFALAILICSIGIGILFYILATPILIKKVPVNLVIFPLIIICNYLVMALGLALNESQIGLSEELLHRPFVWAYFIIVVFSVGIFYYLVGGNQRPKGLSALVLVGLLFSMLCLSVFYYSNGIQSLNGKDDRISIPICQIRVAEFLQNHTLPQEIYWESRADSSLILTAFSQRQAYAVNSKITQLPRSLRSRLEEINTIQKTGDAHAIYKYLKENKVQYFVLNAEDSFQIELEPKFKLIFQCGKSEVYSLL